MSFSETVTEPSAPRAIITPASGRTLSEDLWRIDWSRALPCRFDDGISVIRGSFAHARSFIVEHYPTIFEETAGSPYASKVTSSKERYYELSDFFEFVRGDQIVGLMICAPSDWSTYYMRSGAVLPAYQGAGLLQRFFSRVLFGVLSEAGVERVELDVSPSNLAMVHLVTRLSFNVTGTSLTERWGAHTRFTKYLCPQSQDVFLTQFCSGVKYQLRDARQRTMQGVDQKGERS